MAVILFVFITFMFIVCEFSLARWSESVEHNDKIAPCVMGVAVMLVYIGIVLILTSGAIVTK